MLTLLHLACLSMYLRRVITADAFVCRRGELHPMSYSISHNLCNCSLTSTHLLVACRYTCQWHWSTLRPRGTARLRHRWLWASFGPYEVPHQLPLRTYQHYCRMLLTRHYDQRPFDKTVCDALITNGNVKNHQKRCKRLRWWRHQTHSDFSCVCDAGHKVDPYKLFAMR